jgi:hypothetical protein
VQERASKVSEQHKSKNKNKVGDCIGIQNGRPKRCIPTTSIQLCGVPIDNLEPTKITRYDNGQWYVVCRNKHFPCPIQRIMFGKSVGIVGMMMQKYVGI